MKIRTSNITLDVESIIGTRITKGTGVFPAMKIIVPNGIRSDEVSALLSGSFEILDDDGTVIGTHEGYTTLKEISVTIGKITTAEERIIELENELSTVQSENTELQEVVDIIVEGE